MAMLAPSDGLPMNVHVPLAAVAASKYGVTVDDGSR
jgi:hypothetical protein